MVSDVNHTSMVLSLSILFGLHQKSSIKAMRAQTMHVLKVFQYRPVPLRKKTFPS
jgi:hypothetical protein